MSNTVTVQEVQDRVDEMMVKMRSMLVDFENETACKVRGVDLDRMESSDGRSYIVDVNVDVGF